MDSLEEISQNIIHGEFNETQDLVRGALDGGRTPETILSEGLFAGMDVVGRLFREEECYIPEVLLAAKAMQAGIDVLGPLLEAEGGRDMGKVVFGTVKGDMHNLGKNLVSIMLRGVGFKIIDIGENVSADKFISRAVSEGADILAMSALLTTTMDYMGKVIEEVEKNGLTGKLKILVGGACLTQRFADEIRADGYAANAGEAVVVARELVRRG